MSSSHKSCHIFILLSTNGSAVQCVHIIFSSCPVAEIKFVKTLVVEEFPVEELGAFMRNMD